MKDEQQSFGEVSRRISQSSLLHTSPTLDLGEAWRRPGVLKDGYRDFDADAGPIA